MQFISLCKWQLSLVDDLTPACVSYLVSTSELNLWTSDVICKANIKQLLDNSSAAHLQFGLCKKPFCSGKSTYK